MLASRTRRLYIGITSDLQRRVWEHRHGIRSTFASGYNMVSLVWFEDFGWVDDAIAREKQVKRWRREKKIALIEAENPAWRDLAVELGFEPIPTHSPGFRPR
jgi:putative endonuclease